MITTGFDNINWYCLLKFRFTLKLCKVDWKNIQKSLFCKVKKWRVLWLLASKKEIRDKENQERLANAISTLDSIARNNNIQKNIRNIVREILIGIKDEKNGSISVRAANTISMLDNVTQNPQMQSHIRTLLWQVVSTLESIRE
jgi:hypothetical protein